MSSRRSATGRSSKREQTSPKEGGAELGGDRVGDDGAGTTVTVDRHPYGPDRLAAQPDQDEGEGVAVEAVDRADRAVEVDCHHFRPEEPELALPPSRQCGHGVAVSSADAPPRELTCRSYESRKAAIGEHESRRHVAARSGTMRILLATTPGRVSVIGCPTEPAAAGRGNKERQR